MARRRRRYYPRRLRRFRRRGSATIPVAAVGGLLAGMVEPADYLIKGQYIDAMNSTVANYTGYQIWTKSWNLEALKKGLLPLIAGILIHKFVGGSPLNVNRALGRARVPLLRI